MSPGFTVITQAGNDLAIDSFVQVAEFALYDFKILCLGHVSNLALICMHIV